MNERKFNQVMQGQSGSAKKVYEAVPKAIAWPPHQILTEVRRTNPGFNAPLEAFIGILSSLKSDGLIKEPRKGCYIRSEVRPAARKSPRARVAEVKEAQETVPPAVLPVEGKLEKIADQLVELSEHLLTISLQMAEEKEKPSESEEKMLKMREAMKAFMQD